MDFNFILGLVLSSLIAAGKPKALELLQELHDKDVHIFKAVLFSLNAGAEHLKAITDKTATSLDDDALKAVQEILAGSAANNGIVL